MQVEPEYNFTPTNLDTRRKYNDGFAVDELFTNYSVGVVTAKDKVLIASSKQALLSQVKSFYGIEPDMSKVRPIYYRPLDKQFIYYDPKLLERSRESLMSSFFFDNIGLITARSNKGEDCSQFIATDIMSEAKCGERTTQSAVFPLYTYSERFGKQIRTLNLNKEILDNISGKLGRPFSDNNGTAERSFSGEDLLAYIYGVFYLEGYREKYKQFINAAYPRVPYPTSTEIFDRVSGYGYRLMNLHLMRNELPLFEKDTHLIGQTLEKVTYKNSDVKINKDCAFEAVSERAWKFTMCGYQPLQKWLKDRRGVTLTEQDIIRFRSMQKCIEETIQIVKEMSSDKIATAIIP